MIKEIIIGKRYHLKFVVSDLMPVLDSDLSYNLTFRNPSGTELVKYRLQVNGTWQTWVNLPTTGSTFQMIINQNLQQLSKVVMGTPTILCTTFAGSNITAFEICGFVSSNTFDESLEDVDKFFKRHMDDASVSIRLYTNTEEVNVVEKNPTFVAYMWGTFRQEVDVLNPSIIIESDELPRFNYIWIEELYRFYFVRNIIILRDGIYRIDCHVDVLSTYWQDIEDQTEVFILRTENGGGYSLVDNRKPLSSIPTITYTDVSGGTKSNVSFNDSYSQSGNEHRFYVLALRDLTQQKNNLNPPTGVTLPTISDKTSDHEARYILTYLQFSRLLKGLYNNSALSSYIENIIYLPFNFDTLTATYIADKLMVNDKYLKVDSTWTSDGTDYQVQSCNGWGYTIPYLIVADFNITEDYSDEESFLNIEPYTRYDIYLPFIGWVNLPAVDVSGKNILVYYAMNEEDGTATCYVLNYDDQKIVYSGTCQIGVRIGVDYTNALELSAQKNANVLNTALGGLSGVLSAGIGIFTGKPLAGVAGIMGTTKALESGINRDAMMFEKAQTTTNGSSTAMYGDITHVYLKKQQLSKVTIDEDVYAHMNGYPVNQYGDMSTYVGTGYIECVIHWSSSNSLITQAEVDEIESLAKGGIII